MFLLDTNCWMQLVRDREHAGDVRRLLQNVPLHRVFISIYSVHSIGTVLVRRGFVPGYAEFIKRTLIGADIGVITIPLVQLGQVEAACLAHSLDFDDAYQYVAAETNNLTLVSLDADFDRTPRGRVTPEAALQRFTDEQKP
jgi:predicted nucleic acid-binding protein